MITYRELVYMILDECKQTYDDSRIEPEHIIFLINKYRAIFIKQRYGGIKKNVPKPYYQTFTVPSSAYDNLILGDFKSIKTSIQIPNILNVHGTLLETIVSFKDDSELDAIPIAFINPERFKFVGNNPWLKDFIYTTISHDNYFCIKGYVQKYFGKALLIKAIFENPMELSTEEPLDVICPIEHALIQPIVESVLKELLPILYIPTDVKNDSADDLLISTTNGVGK